MSLLSSSEVVQFAVNIEENGYHYYRSIAEKLASNAEKDIFNYLADEERKHIKTFETMLKQIERFDPPGRERASACLDYAGQVSDVFAERFRGRHRGFGADSSHGVQLLDGALLPKIFGPSAGADVALREIAGDGQTAHEEGVIDQLGHGAFLSGKDVHALGDYADAFQELGHSGPFLAGYPFGK